MSGQLYADERSGDAMPPLTDEQIRQLTTELDKLVAELDTLVAVTGQQMELVRHSTRALSRLTTLVQSWNVPAE
jgi:hypothetical protein